MQSITRIPHRQSSHGHSRPGNHSRRTARNPIRSVWTTNRPFIYYHTQTVTRQTIAQVAYSGKSIEVDISVDQQGKPYIGHAASWYVFKHKQPPHNLPLDTALAELLDKDLFVVLDCKDNRALAYAQDIVTHFGADRVMVHGYIDSLRRRPYAPGIIIEPEWDGENLPDQRIAELYQATGVPMVLACRGLTREILESEHEKIITDILKIANRYNCAVNFSLPDNAAPPLAVMNELLEHKVLTLLAVDKVQPGERPRLYLGYSDDLAQATDMHAVRVARLVHRVVPVRRPARAWATARSASASQ